MSDDRVRSIVYKCVGMHSRGVAPNRTGIASQKARRHEVRPAGRLATVCYRRRCSPQTSVL